MLLTSMIFNLYKGNALSGSISIILFLHIIIIYASLIYLGKKLMKKNKNLYYREELFNSLCSNIDDVFAIYHLNNKEFEYISPNLERLYGVSSKALKENPDSFLQYTDLSNQDEIIKTFTNNLFNENYEKECEYCHPKNNKKKWIIIRLYPVFSNFKIIRYICCLSDISGVKKSQQLLKNAFLDSQKANEAKKEFLSHMSHELRTPINEIIGMSRIASNSIEDKDRVENCLEKITNSSKNLLEIINNILDVVKIDSNKLNLAEENFHIIKFLNSFIAVKRNQAETNLQELELVLTDIHDDYLFGDRLRLEQILCNCVSNSSKFTPSGGKIKLEVCEVERHVNKALFRFTITDNGNGMSEDFIDRLYIPFEQEDSSIARKYGGSGLGMSITKNLVMLMGGNIHVSSKLGVGTIITIEIVFEIVKNSEMETTINKKHVDDYNFAGHRILVVEDNDINLEITCELLKNVHVTVETAMNGYKALELFEASSPGYYEVILMDVQMPGLNGYETAKAIRSSTHPDANSILIIAMSADTSVEDISFNMDCGMNNHVTKPIDIDYFYLILQKVFQKEANFTNII